MNTNPAREVNAAAEKPRRPQSADMLITSQTALTGV
jgi:hypothetical protein